MPGTQRVLITQNNAEGRSTILADKNLEASSIGVFNLWQTYREGMLAQSSGPDSKFGFFPDLGGTLFRLFTIPPEDSSASLEEIKATANQFFANIGWPEARRDTRRHPLMHVTPTIDYILLLSGEISLLLDEGDPLPLKPFDAVIQRGTNHWWLNTGKDTALLMAVLVGNK